MTQWNNEDGLHIRYGSEQATPDVPSLPKVNTLGVLQQMVIDIDYDNLPAETADLDNDGTNDGWSNHDTAIPAGSAITRAILVVETAFAGGTSYNFGLSQQDGTVIDADGIDAGVATAALAANDVVNCDGALVGGAATIGANAAYLKVAATGTFTAGKAKLLIEYLPVGT